MVRTPKTAVVGAFVLGACLLLMASLVLLGSAKLLRRPVRFVSFFNESVNGLDVGSPVKFRGVTIGQVTSVQIAMDDASRSYLVPVEYAISEEKVEQGLGSSIRLRDKDFMSDQVQRGLRARLQSQSFITGQIYVELDFLPADKAASEPLPPARAHPEGLFEIPSHPSLFAALGQNLSDFTTKLATVDFAELASQLRTLLASANSAVGSLNLPEVAAEIRGAARSVQGFAGAPELRQAVERFGAAMEEIRSTAASLRQGAGPGLEKLGPALDRLSITLREVEKTAAALRRVAGERGELNYEVTTALRQVSAAAESVQQLADLVNRHPEALVWGVQTPPPPKRRDSAPPAPPAEPAPPAR